MIPRIHPACCLIFLACTVLSCGDSSDSRSPTEPAPTASTATGPLTGHWRGEITGSDDDAGFRCDLELRLGEPQSGFHVGSWTVACAQVTVRGTVTVIQIAGHVLIETLSSLQQSTGPSGFANCGWGALVPRQGNRISGPWSPVDNCEDTDFGGGTLTLDFRG